MGTPTPLSDQLLPDDRRLNVPVVRAADVRAGDRLEGVPVLWSRPVPDYDEVCIALDLPEHEPKRYRWYHPEAPVTLTAEERSGQATTTAPPPHRTA
jgi:hypothetical protein